MTEQRLYAVLTYMLLVNILHLAKGAWSEVITKGDHVMGYQKN